MKIFEQNRKNVNYMACMSDSMIEICNNPTITFGKQSHFFSQLTSELFLAWKVFDCLLQV